MSANPYWERLSGLKRERSSYETHWREIGLFIAPKRYRERGARENDGLKAYHKILDETGMFARRVFVAGFMAGMTSPARPWFKLVTSDADLMDSSGVREYLEQVERRIRLALSRSNFYQAIAHNYDDLGTFGTAAMSCMEGGDRSAVWFYPHTLGQYWIGSNDQGVTDVMYRQTSKTVGQLVQQYGIENVSDTVKRMYRNNSLESWVPCVQAIEPNDDRVPGRIDFDNMPYRSVWFEEGQDGQEKYLAKRGFLEFPTMAPRWDVTAQDAYGVDCPGMLSLPGSKQLMAQQRRKGQAIDLLVRPPLQAPSSMEAKGVSNILPGGISYVSGEGLRPVYEVRPQIQEMLGDIAEVQERISRAFFVDMFLMISQTDDVRTATEIAVRNEEKLLMLGPVLQRVQTELLDPVIDRVFSIMERNELLPPPPPELQGQELRVEYISMMAQAQQSVGTSAIERTLGLAGNMAGVKPDILDKVDFDVALEEYAAMTGAPQRMILSSDDVAAVRMQRAQAEQAAAAMENMAQGASAAELLSRTEVRPDNALGQIMGGVANG